MRSRQHKKGRIGLGKLPAGAACLLKASHYDLIGRATWGTPSKLRTFAGQALKVRDALRFRLPAFAAYLQDLADQAELTALKKESARLKRAAFRRTTYRNLGLTGTARFARRGPQ